MHIMHMNGQTQNIGKRGGNSHFVIVVAKWVTFLKNFTGVQLIHSVVLVSGIQQSESIIHIHLSALFLDSFPIQAITERDQSSLWKLVTFTDICVLVCLEKEMATHSSILAWRIPGTAEPGGLPSMGSHRVGHD